MGYLWCRLSLFLKQLYLCLFQKCDIIKPNRITYLYFCKELSTVVYSIFSTSSILKCPLKSRVLPLPRFFMAVSLIPFIKPANITTLKAFIACFLLVAGRSRTLMNFFIPFISSPARNVTLNL